MGVENAQFPYGMVIGISPRKRPDQCLFALDELEINVFTVHTQDNL
jgi:hypothetical protein